MKKTALLIVLLVLALTFATPAYGEVTLASLVINEEITPGASDIYLTVTGVLSNGSNQTGITDLIWRSSDTSIATVNTQGMVHFTGKGGPLTITVLKGSASGSKTINVRPWPKSLHIETDLVYSENSYRLLVQGRFSDGEERYFAPEDNLQWSTSNPYVAWVNSQGVVTFSGEPGSVTIRAIWGSLDDAVNTTVHDSEDEEDTAYRSGIKIKDEDIKYSTTPLKLTLVTTLSDGTEEELENYAADWSSNNTDIVTVNSEGEIRFTGKAGVAKIKAVYGGYSYERTITVDRFLVDLKINQSLNYTSSWEDVPLQLSVTGKYNDGSEQIFSSGVTWAADNKKVAAITAEGLLTFSGEGGKLTVKASAPGCNGAVVEDAIQAQVPAAIKAKPYRIFLDLNPLSSKTPMEPKVCCIYDDGSLRDVTNQTTLISETPQTASVFQNKIYISPNAGPIQIRAVYQGLSDNLTGYVNILSGKAGQVQQLRLKEHDLAFTYRSVKLSALAVMGDGRIKDVTSQVTWRSSQPLVAKISRGVLTFSGRIGKAVITVQGYGFRDELALEVTPGELQPRVESLTISGSLNQGASQLRAIAFFNDGSVKDVTQEAVWNTGNRNIAQVSQGLVMFLNGFKPVAVTVHYGGQEAGISRD